MTSFELSINFFKKILQFFMSDFLHSKYAKRSRICDMSRAEIKTKVLPLSKGKLETNSAIIGVHDFSKTL